MRKFGTPGKTNQITTACLRLIAVLIGALGHVLRRHMARRVPARKGWFPLACYVVGGVQVILSDALLHGRRHALDVALDFILVGTGVVGAYLLCHDLDVSGFSFLD